MPFERDYFNRIIELKGDGTDYENSLENLLIFLNRYYGKRVVILIDEYDAPVHAGFINGYYEQVVNFTRNFLGGGLKDTDQYLEKAVLTGIMRVAKESIFNVLADCACHAVWKIGNYKVKEGFTYSCYV